MATTRRPAASAMVAPTVFDGSGYMAFPANASQELTAQTLLFSVAIHGFNVQAIPGIIFAQSDTNTPWAGMRIQSSTNELSAIECQFASTGSAYVFFRTLVFQKSSGVHNGAITWNGVGVNPTDLVGYAMDARGGQGPFPLIKYSSASPTPTGSPALAPGQGISMGGLNNGTLRLPVAVYYLARWDRVLSHEELLKAQRLGPLAVRDGLVFFWMNGRDHGPYGLVPSYCSAGEPTPKLQGKLYTFARPGLMHRVHSPRQFAAPIADISNNGWTPSTGADRYATIDEAAPADFSDYDFSPTDPAGEQFEVELQHVATPPNDDGHLLRYGLHAVALDTVFTLKLYQGASQLDSWTDTVTAAEGDVLRFHQLSTAVASSITDYCDLRIRGSAAAP